MERLPGAQGALVSRLGGVIMRLAGLTSMYRELRSNHVYMLPRLAFAGSLHITLNLINVKDAPSHRAWREIVFCFWVAYASIASST